MLSWSDTIHGLKFIPTYSGSFTVKSITLYASLPHTTLYGKNGRELRFGDYLPKLGGEIYVPLDPNSGLYGSLGYKYEWIKNEGRLELFNKEHKITLVIGKAYAVKDGESYTLVRPPFFKDGIPTISLADVCKLFDISYEEKENKVFLK